MDRVRFGRALGFGARQAMKTLVTAVDAATAENPSAARPASRAAASASSPRTAVVASQAPATTGQRPAAEIPASAPRTHQAARTAARTVVQAREVKQGLGRGSRRFGEAVWRPFVRLSGVLWLEVSGVFFGIFALLALGWGWKVRAAWHANPANAADHRRLLGALFMLVLFGYFCISSFLRARRRERQR